MPRLRLPVPRGGGFVTALLLTAHLSAQGTGAAGTAGAAAAAAAVAAAAAQAAAATGAPINAATATTGTSGPSSGSTVPRVVAIAAARTTISDPAWSDPAGTIDTSQTRAAPPARLVNLSVRGMLGSGGDPLIAGAVVAGSDTLPTLVRAIGPGLAQFGVTNPLNGPELAIFHGNTLAAQTNTLGAFASAVSAYVGAFPAVPSANGMAFGDAALVGRPAAGTLTAHCANPLGNSGLALLEFYDTDPNASATSARFVNFSARARVGAGEGQIVVGFVIAGQGELNLLLRAAGPTLQDFNVPDLVGDPVIELYAGGTLIASNDNWRSSAQSALAVQAAESSVGTFALTSPADAAMIVTLPAGSYTLQVRDTGGGTGVALAEIYELATAARFDAAQAINAVGLALYRQLAPANPAGNLVLSPYSIESALAMAYAGAEADTRREMAAVLRLPDDTATLQSGFAALRLALDDVAEQSKQLATARTAAGRPTDAIAWHAANRLFGHQGYAFRDSFLTLMREGFVAPLDLLDFRRNTEGARLTINGWVEEQTRDKIRNLIPAGGLTEDTRLVLVNALYLNAPWENPFEKASTTPQPFHSTPGSSREAPTMRQAGRMGHAAETGLTVVTLDYLGGGLQFVIVLPDEGTTADAVAARLTSADFARWATLGTTSRTDVALFLPKFRVEGATVPLSATLKTMGMNSAFDVPPGSANFDRIAPRRPDEYLAISDVFHQTFIALDEQGTEAAAATAVVVGVVTVLPPPAVEVRVDRPFLFAIQHRASGACLFLGRIADPR